MPRLPTVQFNQLGAGGFEMTNMLAYSPRTVYENGDFASACTSGGDTLPILQKLNVTDKVLDQTDKSLNKRLWALYPVDKPLDAIKAVGRDAHIKLLVIKALPVHDRDQRHQLYILVHSVCQIIEDEAQRSVLRPLLDRTADPKFYNQVEPVRSAIARLNVQKERANALLREGQRSSLHKQFEALVLYLQTLLELAPWHPSPLLFTGQQAHELGVAQLYGSLLVNLALACNQLGKADPRFYRKSMQFASLVIEMRYARHTTLMTAIKTLNNARTELCRDVVYQDPGQMPAHVHRTLEKMAKKAHDGWAHEKCLTAKHEGCM